MGLNLGEIVVVVTILVLVFGVARLPQIGEAIGKMRRNYRRGLKGDDAIDITPRRVGAGGEEASVPKRASGGGRRVD